MIVVLDTSAIVEILKGSEAGREQLKSFPSFDSNSRIDQLSTEKWGIC